MKARNQPSAAAKRRERWAKNGVTDAREMQQKAREGAALRAGGKVTQQFIEAGASSNVDAASIRRVLQNQQLIIDQSKAELVAGSVVAARFMLAVIRGDVEGSTVGNRLEAAKTVLQMTQVIEKEGKDGKTVNQMDTTDLRAFIEAGSARLAELKRLREAAVTVDCSTDDNA